MLPNVNVNFDFDGEKYVVENLEYGIVTTLTVFLLGWLVAGSLSVFSVSAVFIVAVLNTMANISKVKVSKIE